MIYENEKYYVTADHGLGTDKNYKVVNKEFNKVEYSSDILLEALRMAKILDMGLEAFYSERKEPLYEIKEWEGFTVN